MNETVVVLYDSTQDRKKRYGIFVHSLPPGIVFDEEHHVFLSPDSHVARWFPPVLFGLYVLELVVLVTFISRICVG